MNWLFLPPWSVRLIAAAGLTLVVFLTLRALRERHTVPLARQILPLAMRLLVILLLLAILLNPTLLTTRKSADRPTLTLLVDTSYSMATSDLAGKSRLEAALAVLKDPSVLSRIEKDFVLDVRRFDRDVAPIDLASLSSASATGRSSDLASALSTAVGDLADRKDQAGILLVSDGRATTEGALDAARLALARSVPLWTCCLGSDVPRRDLWIDVPNSEVLAFSDSDVELSATLHQVGYPNRVFNVNLSDGLNVLDSCEVTLPAGRDQASVHFKVKAPARAERRFVVSVPALPDEAEKDNNDRSVFVRAVGSKVRVLVVEGQPHWDTKFLVQCLKRNDRVDVTAIYRLGPNRQFSVLSADEPTRREAKDLFPRTPQDFDRYDVVIMGRNCETFFDDKTEQCLTDFVARRGGGLIFSRGKPYGGRFPALAKFEPVVWGSGVAQSVRLVPTDSLTQGPVFELTSPDDLQALITRLPLFDQILRTAGAKPLAVVLADGLPASAPSPASVPTSRDDSPVVMAYQLYGQGRVVTLNASGLWRWSFRQNERPEDEFVYDQFWSGLLRWMLSGSDFLAGHDVALRADRRLCTDEQTMQFLVRTRGLDVEAYRPRLTITGPNTSTQIDPTPAGTAGTYLAAAGPFPPGSYQVRLVNNVGQPPELTMTVEVVSASIENRVLSADPDLMRKLADLSEGRVLAPRDVADIGSIVHDWQARRQLAEDKQSLWDRWWLLAAGVLILAAEWFSRRREGLL